MKIGAILKAALGLVVGLFGPAVEEAVADTATALQQKLAALYGDAAAKMCASLTDPNMSGRDKAMAVAEAIANTAIQQGWKASFEELKALAVPVATTAFLTIEDDIKAKLASIEMSMHLATGLTKVTDLVPPEAPAPAAAVA